MRPRKCRTEKTSTTDDGRGVSSTRWWRAVWQEERVQIGWIWLEIHGLVGIKNNITTLLDFLIVFYLVVTAESVYIVTLHSIKNFLFLFTFLRNHVIPLFLVASKNPFPIITVGTEGCEISATYAPHPTQIQVLYIIFARSLFTASIVYCIVM